MDGHLQKVLLEDFCLLHIANIMRFHKVHPMFPVWAPNKALGLIFRGVCLIFSPIYRQPTSACLGWGSGGGAAPHALQDQRSQVIHAWHLPHLVAMALTLFGLLFHCSCKQAEVGRQPHGYISYDWDSPITVIYVLILLELLQCYLPWKKETF